MAESPAGHLVTARRPRHRATGLSRVGTSIYLGAARAAARYLGRCDIVESVYARRSLAAGEIAFGRSDIDLGIRLYDACAGPGQAEPLVALRRRMHRLTRVVPIVGEAEVFDPAELEDWVRLEPVREAFDRCAVLLHGRAFRIPPWTIRREDAAARFCFWFDRYLPAALARRNRRNLRKFALEMWATLAVAQGHCAEPPLSRREMEAAWRRLEPGSGPPSPAASYEELAAGIFDVVRTAHALLLPPLPRTTGHVLATLRLPPTLGRRTLVVGPAPPLVSHGGARTEAPWMPLTPEALDLYLHYANPLVYDHLPPALLDYGFQRPPLERYLAALERWTNGHIARRPAFGSRSYGQGPRVVAYAREAARALAAGARAGPVHPADLGELGRQDARLDGYFREWYCVAYRACVETRALVSAARTRTGPTTAAS